MSKTQARIFNGFVEVVGADRTADTCLGQINLGQETFCGSLVNAASLHGGLRQDFDGLFQCHDDILHDISLLHFDGRVIAAGFKFCGVVVDDGNITKGTFEEEICQSLPYQAFAHGLVFAGF